ncbi:hypothetical protein RB195_002796 [Necator americanus]|uniref:Receptor L-domain domain-containing protein n=1 Tax=Necator americanus TaxID=51031 RepID=A0ABR1DKP2_NECAM
MRLLLLLRFITLSYTFNLCQIINDHDVYFSGNCTHLVLSPHGSVMVHPLLYDKIKTATKIYKFHLMDSNLTQISEKKRVRLAKDAELFLVNNTRLEKLPDFDIEDGKRIKLKIIGNPQLNTTQLLQECRMKRCRARTVNSIQMPFTCAFEQPLPKRCKNISGTVYLKGGDESVQQIEIIYGTLALVNSNMTSFPKLEKLRLIQQRIARPVLVIENNSNLHELDELFGLNFSILHPKKAVRIENNRNLCIGRNYSHELFAIQYLHSVRTCGSTVLPNLLLSFKPWIILLFLSVKFQN